MPTRDRLTEAVRVNLTAAEYDQLRAIATQEGRAVASVVRRAVQDKLSHQAEVAQLRVALAAYRSALRSGEPETDGLRAVGDQALGVLAEAL